MRIARTICVISVAIVCLLAGARSATAKTCDEVWYVAYTGSSFHDSKFTERGIMNSAVYAMKMLQAAMEGEAEKAGLNSDEDVAVLISDMRAEENE